MLAEDERAELKRLCKESKELRIEKDILKKAFFAKEMKYSTILFILNYPGTVITSDTLHLHRGMKWLFEQSLNSLGSSR